MALSDWVVGKNKGHIAEGKAREALGRGEAYEVSTTMPREFVDGIEVTPQDFGQCFFQRKDAALPVVLLGVCQAGGLWVRYGGAPETEKFWIASHRLGRYLGP